MRPALLLAGLGLLVGLVPAQDSAPRRMTPELLWQLQRVSDPQPGPNGRYLIYGVRSYDLAANRGTSQLWLLDLQSGEHRQLTTQGSNFNVCWSPDGSRIAFLSTRAGDPQIFTMRLDGGEAKQITDRDGGVANIAWSPDGSHFSFTAEVKLEPDIHDLYPDLPKANARLFDSLLIRHWNEWKEGRFSHLFVIPVDGGDAKDLMPGERYDTPVKPFGGGEQIGWAPDGKKLCYTAKKVPGSAWASSTDNDLYEVSIDGGEAKDLTDGMNGYDQEPAYSPDGSQIAFVSMKTPGFESDRNRIMVLDRRSGEIRELTQGFDQSAHEVSWAPDGSSLIFTSDVEGTTQVYRVGLQGGLPKAISTGRWMFAAPRSGAHGHAVYALRQRMERPYEIVRLDATKPDEGTALTDVNGEVFSHLEMPKVEERWFEATDGKKIQSWVIYPPDFDPSRKWPMLLYCQGGPQQMIGQWFSYRWNFHLMAAKGYIVLAVNRRGLPGFGQAWNDEISRDWGGQAMQDLLSATTAMQKEPYIDRAHCGCIGASFGGYTTYWMMGHNQDDRFCAMVAHCGVFDLRSMYLGTEELFFVDHDLGGPFWRSQDVAKDYDRFSPSSYLANWHTPLLIVEGEQDFRIPATQGIQAFTAAQIQGVPSRLLYYPDECHWVLAPQNGVLWHRIFFDWLDRWCKPSAADASASRQSAAVESGADSQRKWLLQKVDDTAIVQVYADGFDDLSLRDKLLAYHLSQAAIAGRDIFIDQKFAYALPIRDALEELYVHRDVLPDEVRKEVERYTTLFWANNGIHDAITSRKELLKLSKPQFEQAVVAAAADGARFAPKDRLDELFAIMTDPKLYPSCTDKNPANGGDPLVASCNNLYVGVTTEDMAGFDEKYPLNSRVVRLPARAGDGSGEIVEQVYRTGDGKDIPPGLYAAQLNAVIGHLQDALPYAPEKTRNAIQQLIRYYQTGDPADWRQFDIDWVQDTDSVVDQVNGFVEVYVDPRGQKGAWEGIVSFRNEAKTAAIQRLAGAAPWFEARMPWDDAFKKPDVKGISARAISVIVETGDSGPVTPIGINLPNEADIRQQYGSKSVNLANVIEAYDRSKASGATEEFASSPEEVAREKKWAAIADDLHTNLHEVIGHASGLVRPDVGNPADRLGEYYSTLEEARADLVGLYWIADPKMEELGLLPDREAALAEYEAYARNGLVQLRRVALGDKIEEDHMRNRQMIVHWLIANDGGVVVEKRDGKTYYRVTGIDAFRKGVGRLLGEVMRIKATGDYRAGKELVEKYGTQVDPTLHKEVLARIANLHLPAMTAFVQPELRLVRDADGKVVDVKVVYPQSLADQMLRWSGRGR